MKNKNVSFSFSFVTKDTISKWVAQIVCQENDNPEKIIKENLDIVSI